MGETRPACGRRKGHHPLFGIPMARHRDARQAFYASARCPPAAVCYDVAELPVPSGVRWNSPAFRRSTKEPLMKRLLALILVLTWTGWAVAGDQKPLRSLPN